MLEYFFTKKFYIFLLLFFFLAIIYEGSSAIRTNIEIFDSLSKKIANEFIKSLEFRESDSVFFSIKGEDNFLIKKHIYGQLNNLNIVLLEKEAYSTSNHLEVIVDDLKASFNITDEKDIYIREINVKYTFFQKVDGIIKSPLKFRESYQDTVRKSDINQINSENHSFAKAEIPLERPTIFEQILEPLIIVTAAVITVILLFTVRSN